LPHKLPRGPKDRWFVLFLSVSLIGLGFILTRVNVQSFSLESAAFGIN